VDENKKFLENKKITIIIIIIIISDNNNKILHLNPSIMIFLPNQKRRI
jgi:hypothetical protein